MIYTTMKLPINQIIVGIRLREDMGDIAALADSIKKHGLLHPIVVKGDSSSGKDNKFELVAGGRRLEAFKTLGETEIPCKLLWDLSEKEQRVIELEENIRRKDLTEYEKSKNLVELAEITREQVDSFCAPSAHNLANKNGRPVEPGSYRDISSRIGIPESTIREAEKHVQAVDKYPELESMPKKQAIQTAKQLNQIPEEQRAEVIPLMANKDKPASEDGISDEELKELQRAERFTNNVDRLLTRLSVLSSRDPHEYFEGLPSIAFILGKVPIFSQNKLEIIESSIDFLTKLRVEWIERMIEPEQSGIRRVK